MRAVFLAIVVLGVRAVPAEVLDAASRLPDLRFLLAVPVLEAGVAYKEVGEDADSMLPYQSELPSGIFLIAELQVPVFGKGHGSYQVATTTEETVPNWVRPWEDN